MSQTASTSDQPLPRSAPELPNEVLGNIIEESQADGDPDEENDTKSEDLKSLSLVSREWAREAQRVMFRTVILHPAKYYLDNEVIEGPDTLSKFTDLMDTSPYLGGYIKELDITFPGGKPGDESWTNVNDSPRLASALGKIHGLFKLVLRQGTRRLMPRDPNDPWETPGWSLEREFPSGAGGRKKPGILRPTLFIQAIHKLLRQTTLTSLELHNVHFCAHLLYMCKRIQELCLHGVKFYIDPSYV